MWVVIYTKPNFEKKLATDLSKMAIKHYLPIKRIKVQRSDRKVWVDKLLFRSYVFIEHDEYDKNRESICKINGFIKVLYNAGKAVTVSNDEVSRLVDLCENPINIELAIAKPSIGDSIFLKDFQIEGMISRIKKGKTITVYVPSLNVYLTVSAQNET
jgi:transcription antitermination factor NusG